MRQLDFLAAGEQRKSDGQSLVWEHEATEFKDIAIELLRLYAMSNRVIRSDEFKPWAKERGLPEPRHVNSWGCIFTTAARAHVIRRPVPADGVPIAVKSRVTTRHAAQISVWISCLKEL